MSSKKEYMMKFNCTVPELMQKICGCQFIRNIILSTFAFGVLFTSCKSFFDPEQELVIKEDDMYVSWEEYRSAGMGLYSIQQQLADQLLVLGELRGDLLNVTGSATPDLVDVCNFNISKDNQYASPLNFYKLIAACNNLIVQLKKEHPEVLDKSKPVNNYDRLYGEAVCMRAWAYFNAVRIYGKIPYVYESLTSPQEIEAYVNSEHKYVDSLYIDFAPGGFYNDTIRDTTIILEKSFLDQRLVIDTFTYQLETMTKAVGVNYSINNFDFSWQATTWSDDGRHALLGQMYLTDQNYSRAMNHFLLFLNRAPEGGYQKYGIDARFSLNNWKSILSGIDPNEHIYTIWFNKSYQQTNSFQKFFSVLPPNQYMIKPTPYCISNWESKIWEGTMVRLNPGKPELSEVLLAGKPGDFYRGYGVSYRYYKDNVPLTTDTVKSMLNKKFIGNFTDAEIIMDGVDTVVYKYSLNKNEYANDASFIVFRAAGIHLYAAETFAVWESVFGGLETPRTQVTQTAKILNFGYEKQPSGGYTGIRGRVGFADGYEAAKVEDIVYLHDPYNYQITGFINYAGDIEGKNTYVMSLLLDERARELAFEGERFYDLVRIAKRNNDPSFLANRIAEKFSGNQKEVIRQKLMDESNWYVKYYE